MIGSICKNCIFATWDGKIQRGCHRNILWKYDHNIITQEYDNETGQTYYSINGRICYHCRTPQWKERFTVNDLDELFDISREECRLAVELVIMIKPGQTIDDLSKTMLSIDRMILKPTMIYIINSSKEVRPSTLLAWLTDNCFIPWNVEFILDSVDILDMIVPKLKNIYFLVGDAGKEFPNNLISKLDSYIYDDLRKIVMAELVPGELHGLFCMRYLYKNVGGNAGEKTVAEKIKILGEEQKCQNQIVQL